MNQEVKNINGYDIKDIKAIRTYDTVALMKADTKLKEGQHVKTRGYYSINDGGSAEYYIVNEVSENDYKENLENGLYALLISKERTITPEQVGAYGNNINDDSNSLLLAFNIAKNNNLSLKLSKEYYINQEITLNGEGKRINISQSSGFLRIDGQILITDLKYSNIEFNLYQGGTGDVDTYGIIFKLLYKCDLVLYANNVNKTAFFINTQSVPYTASKWNTVKIKGTENVRTLLHGSTTTSQGTTFGEYIDIEDDRFDYPIRFQYATDINILHYENYVNDNTFTKNSLEFYHAGARCSLMCLGGLCKNLLYIEDGYVITDYLLLINEDDEITVQENLRVTGVYVKGDSQFKADYIKNYKCLYTVDAHEMQNQNKCVIGHTYLDTHAVPLGRGSLIPNVAGDNLILSYNSELRASDVAITTSYGDNLKAYKIQDEVHVNGYITISNDTSSNTTLATIGDSDEQGKEVSYCYMKQGDKMLIGRIKKNENTLQNISSIQVADGTNIYIDMVYRCKHV